MSKRRVLFMCAQAPWLRNGGALLRNYWMIDALSKHYAVDLVVADEAASITPAFAARVDDYASFPRTEGQRTGFGRLMRAALPGESTLTAGWTNPALREHVANRLGRYPYAAIQTDLPMQAALPRLDGIPIVYNAHNCESALVSRRAATEAPLARLALMLDAIRVRQQERTLINRSALVATCAEEDLRDFERFVSNVRSKSTIVANGVDVAQYAGLRSVPTQPATVLITGSMNWRPNILGLRWFLRQVLPRLRMSLPDVIVRIAGRMEPAMELELQHYPNIEAVPNPPSMEPHLADATVVAAPILASSGTRLRILEAWAAGRPVITTTAGAFGLNCVPGHELLVRDDAAAFANMLVSMLESPVMRASLTEMADARVQEYDWHTIGSVLLSAYERITSEPQRRRIETIKQDDEVMFSARV
jgi:polysaccharide biosynthesis protein PslH